MAGVHIDAGALQGRDAERSVLKEHAYRQTHVAATVARFVAATAATFKASTHVQAAIQLLSGHELHQLRSGVLLQVRMLCMAAPAPHCITGLVLHVIDSNTVRRMEILSVAREIVPITSAEALQPACVEVHILTAY